MGKSYSKPNIHIMKLQTCLILAFATFSLASPLIQDRTLVAGEKQIRLKLEEVYTELNLENAAEAARETSQQVVAIFADGTSTVTERAVAVKDAVKTKLEQLGQKVPEFNTDAISEKIDEISALAETSYTTYTQRVQSMIGEQRDNIRGVYDSAKGRVQCSVRTRVIAYRRSVKVSR